jgi:predicted nucleic acid-binding protein
MRQKRNNCSQLKKLLKAKPVNYSSKSITSIRVVLSDVLDEDAPQHVRDFYRSIPESHVERIVATEESDALASQYVLAGITSESSLTDCRHVALAFIAGVDVLVSFNCTHIVKLKHRPECFYAKNEHQDCVRPLRYGRFPPLASRHKRLRFTIDIAPRRGE